MRSLLVSLLLLLALVGVAAAQSSSATLEGQVVCSVCWFEADRTKTPFGTVADLECEVDCAARHVPAALAVKSAASDGFKLYLLEEGRFKKTAKNWLPYMANYVKITGAVRSKGDKQYVRVDALDVLSTPKVAASAPQAETSLTEAELVLPGMLGGEQRLSAYRGRIVVLNFWATWCVPCRKEMPDLAKIQNEYAALGVQVIGAAADAPENRAQVTQFIKETKINFPVWLGATAADMERFGLGQTLPGTVIIGPDGKVSARIRGVVKEADLRKRIDTLIGAAMTQAQRDEMAAARTKQQIVSSVPS